jgi:hypothetical protein
MSMIDKKWDYNVLKMSPYLTIFIIALLSLVLFSYQLFQFNITLNSSEIFLTKNMENYFSTTFKVIEVIVFGIRDGLFLIVLLVLNFFLFKKFRICMENKRKMVKYSQPSTATTNPAINPSNRENMQSIRVNNQTQQERAKRSINLMILFCCLNSTFERIPIFLAFIYKNLNEGDEKAINLMLKVGTLTVRIAYILKFFIYYYFNNRFRRKFADIFLKNILYHL